MEQNSNDSKGVIFWILMIFMAFMGVLSSCDKNEELEATNLIVGRWYYQEESRNGRIIIYDRTQFNDCEVPKEEYVEFTNDNTLIAFYYSNCEDSFQRGTYSIDGNEIIARIEGVEQVSTVNQLEEKKLVFQFLSDYNGDGVEDEIIQTFYKK